jgi:hypothetical protein
MADNQFRHSQPGWRNAPAKGAARAGTPAWKGAVESAAATRQPWSRKSKLLFGGALVGVLVGAFVIVLLLLRPVKPFRLVVLTAGYETNLAVPHNVAGKRSGAQLAAWARNVSAHPSVEIEVREAALTDDLKTLETALEGCNEPTVVLFVSAHGAADEQGPYLVPQNCEQPDPSAARVRLHKILDRLAQLPAGTRKLLILDATQVPAHWPLGLFHNDFARALGDERTRKRIDEIPGLVVLAASAEGQRSWVSEEWGQTIFAHHVLEGLKGATESGGRVNAYDLHRYALDKVKRWARHNREASQTPVLLGSEERARALELVAVEGGYKAPNPADIKPFEVPAELAQAWAESHRLATLPAPSPAVHTPHLWREHLEVLLRYEQLLRAGDRASADSLSGRLGGLRQRILAARSRKLDSAIVSLTMPAALGWPAPEGDKARAKELGELWVKKADEKKRDPVKDRLEQWLQAEKDPWQKRLLRARLGGMVLRQAAANPERDLKRARAILADLEEPPDPRTAEAQYLVLLQPDLAADPPWATVKDALEVRQQAEEAALGLRPGELAPDLPPYSEHILPWTRKLVEAGDKERRDGQDFLIASHPDEWKEAAENLTGRAPAKGQEKAAEKGPAGARKHYRDAQDLALTLRKALKERDEALAALPYFSQALARQRVNDVSRLRGFEEKVKAQLDLWDAVRQLDALLRDTESAPAEKLAKLTEAVSKGMKDVRDGFEARYKQGFQLVQEDWHEIDNLLGIPFVPPERRVALLKRLREISQKLNEEVKEAGGERDPGEAQVRKMNQSAALAQARLAVAALGEDAFDRAKGGMTFGQVKTAIENTNEGRWREDLTRAGDELARRWNGLPAWVGKQVADARKLDPARAVGLTRTAVAVARRLPGSAVAWVGAPDPLEEQRRVQLYELFCWQGERTSLDFHAAVPGPKRPHYYRVAGGLYAEDARLQLAGEGPGTAKEQELRLARLKALRAELEDDARTLEVLWSLDGHAFDRMPARVSLTDEKIIKLWYGLRAARTVPPGRPVLWRAFERGATFLAPPPEQFRSVQPGVSTNPREAAVLYPLEKRPDASSPPLPESAKQVVEVRYRGHRFRGETNITYFALPDTASALPVLPPTGKLAIQTTEEVMKDYAVGQGGVVLVLDCSGSMNTEVRPGTTRFQEAKKALIAVLKGIPLGTQVSVWAFSHRYRFSDGKDMARLNADPEDYIERIYFAKKWKWSPANEADVQDRLKKLVPWNETPIVRALMEARSDFKRGHDFKTVLVLTDGMDNRFEARKAHRGDSVYNRNGARSIPEFLEEKFGKQNKENIAVRLVGFQLPRGEETEFDRQFKTVLPRLRPAGKFFKVGNYKELIEALRKSVPQRLFFSLFDADGELVKGWSVNDVTLQGNNSAWATLRPGLYTVVMEGKKKLEQKVDIVRGIRLRLNLSLKNGEFILRRDLIEESFVGRPNPKQESRDWRLTVLQNQSQVGEDAIELTVTAEKLRSQGFRDKDLISHLTPRLILFQARSLDDPKAEPPSLRYYRLADYTAPAWGLDVKPWVRDARPALEAFWSEGKPEVAGTLERPKHFGADLAVTPGAATVQVQLNKKRLGEVRLLSLTTEKRPVEGSKEPVDCLVVRLTFPEGMPVMVQLPGDSDHANSGGQEHRFYSKAGKYTGIFWPITQQEAQQRIHSLNLISLDGFREAAVESRQYVRFELGRPDNEPRPSPPQ